MEIDVSLKKTKQMWLQLFILISLIIHKSTSRVCVLNKCREMSGGSGGDGVTCELLERLLDDLVVEDEIEMDSGLKLACTYIFSQITHTMNP